LHPREVAGELRQVRGLGHGQEVPSQQMEAELHQLLASRVLPPQQAGGQLPYVLSSHILPPQQAEGQLPYV
jgi:hypothetical protein